MSRDWTFFLEDILEAANKVLRYTNGLTLETFQRDELVFDAVVRNLEIIGEAALSDNPVPHRSLPHLLAVHDGVIQPDSFSISCLS